ncbi:MAG TPA: ATP-binding protein [Terriglobales bacterium]|nr:ATP-binding protein [Terriglobales bacterium]
MAGSHAVIVILAVALAAAVAVAVAALRRASRLREQASHAALLARQSEHERDMAQQVLAHRVEEERELTREKTQFQAKLADYEKYAALAQLALGAAHEINNPLLGIFSHLELELKGADDPDQRTEIEACLEGAKRISSTVRGLLNYARPGPLRLSRISLERLVDDTFSFLRHQPMFHAIELQKQIPPDLPAITADANQISQVLMNLLLNAGQAMPQGGTITVSADKVKFEDRVEVRVADNGCGIPADILPRIFEPFFTTKRGQGTGLGLSISQAYVRNHHGDMEVESVPNRGTTVRFNLPVRQAGHPAPQPEEELVS